MSPDFLKKNILFWDRVFLNLYDLQADLKFVIFLPQHQADK